MSLAAYKVLHLLGAFLVLAALGAALAGGSRKGSGIAHGIGLLLLLVAGFGALARLGQYGLAILLILVFSANILPIRPSLLARLLEPVATALSRAAFSIATAF